LLGKDEDKNRFTPYRLGQMFADWREASILPCGGILTQIAQNRFRWSQRKPRPVRMLLAPLRWLSNLVSLFDRPNAEYAVNFLVVAKK